MSNFCILCLRGCSKKEGPSTAFRMLLRYLKINTVDLIKDKGICSSQLLGDSSDSVGSVSLCLSCSSITNEFLQLFQEFEIIRLELDNCAGKLYQTIKEGDGEGSSCAKENQKRIHTAGIAETLRKVTLEKCAGRMRTSSPRVLIKDKDEPPRQIAKVCPPKREIGKGYKSDLEFQSPFDPLPLGDDKHSDQSPLEFCKVEVYSDSDHDNTSSPLPEQDPLEEGAIHYKYLKNVEKRTRRWSGGEANRGIKLKRIILPCGKYQCRLCDTIFEDESTFNTHYVTFHMKKCDYCPNVYSRNVNLDSHIATVHTLLKFSDKLPPNTSDDELLIAVKSLIQQWETVSSLKDFTKINVIVKSHKYHSRCGLCVKIFKSNYFLKTHILEAHMDHVALTIVQLRANVTSEESTEITESLGRFDAESKNEEPSRKIPKVSTPKIRKEMHKQVVELPPPIPIDPLDGDTPLSSSSAVRVQDPLEEEGSRKDEVEALNRITLNRKKLPPPKFKCSVCGKIFANNSTFQTHFMNMHINNRFKCDYCPATYANRSYRTVHIATCHTLLKFSDRLPPNTTEYELTISMKSLIQQWEISHKDGLRCGICEKMSETNFLLKKHILEVHSDQVTLAIERMRENASSENEQEIIVEDGGDEVVESSYSSSSPSGFRYEIYVESESLMQANQSTSTQQDDEAMMSPPPPDSEMYSIESYDIQIREGSEDGDEIMLVPVLTID